MRISVCIPAVRTAAIEHAVRSVQRQTFQDWELVVVGQGDEVALRNAVARGANGDPRIRYVHLNRRNKCAALNIGVASTTGEIVAFMDDDCEAQADWLLTLDECFTPDIGFVCGTVKAPEKKRGMFAVSPRIAPKDVVFDPKESGGGFPPGFGLLGANLAVRRSDAERVGVFDECLGPGSQFAGGEEHDYASRLAQLGVRMRSTPRSVVDHTYGYWYGIGAVYATKRRHIRGDGGFAAKRTLLNTPPEALSVRKCLLRETRSQLRTIKPWRLPSNSFRLFYYLTSYRECLIGYEVCDSTRVHAASAVLRPLPQARSK